MWSVTGQTPPESFALCSRVVPWASLSQPGPPAWGNSRYYACSSWPLLIRSSPRPTPPALTLRPPISLFFSFVLINTTCERFGYYLRNLIIALLTFTAPSGWPDCHELPRLLDVSSLVQFLPTDICKACSFLRTDTKWAATW